MTIEEKLTAAFEPHYKVPEDELVRSFFNKDEKVVLHDDAIKTTASIVKLTEDQMNDLYHDMVGFTDYDLHTPVNAAKYITAWLTEKGIKDEQNN